MVNTVVKKTCDKTQVFTRKVISNINDSLSTTRYKFDTRSSLLWTLFEPVNPLLKL